MVCVPRCNRRSSFNTQLFLANPKAVEQNRRFIDEDLNRCFRMNSLASTDRRTYESLRAFYLNQMIGPKGASKHDAIFDMHTSTSNCGVMLILKNNNLINRQLAAYIQCQITDAKILYTPPIQDDQSYLTSICPYGLTVEIGPVPQGLLRSDRIALTAEVVNHGLDYLHALNEGKPKAVPESIEVFEFKEEVMFPQVDDAIAGTIHPSLQDRDYEALNYGDPMFECFDGSVLAYEKQETVYPVFINEAAYYYKNVAMALCWKKTLLTTTGLELT
ncbi:MAG: aspartoacylase [Cyanobacteria bacterium J06642_11]